MDNQCTVLPDGSAFATASWPLPKDHWLYAPRGEWDSARDEYAECPLPILTNAQRQAVTAASRYAIRGATMCGQEQDFDPDALVQNLCYALCGPAGGAQDRQVPFGGDMSFDSAFSATMRREGGYKLHTVAGDRGGMTYAGVSRKFHPDWPGWRYIDDGATPPTELVREFYRLEFWNRLNCDAMPERIAASIFDFGVNAGVRTAAKLAQAVAGVEADGVIGRKTIAALLDMGEDKFEAAYAIAKFKRYAEIVNRDRSQSKFLLGWMNRTLDALT